MLFIRNFKAYELYESTSRVKLCSILKKGKFHEINTYALKKKHFLNKDNKENPKHTKVAHLYKAQFV